MGLVLVIGIGFLAPKAAAAGWLFVTNATLKTFLECST
jgi:hypothetical protein